MLDRVQDQSTLEGFEQVEVNAQPVIDYRRILPNAPTPGVRENANRPPRV